MVLLACPAFARETLDRIAAEVNGEIVLYSEVRERAFQMSSMGGTAQPDPKEFIKPALESLVDEKLIIQYGKEKEIKVTAMELDKAVEDFRKRTGAATMEDFSQMLTRAGLTMDGYRKMLGDQLLARKVISMEVRSQVQLSEDAVKDWYGEHKDLFTGRPKIRVSHILKYLPKTASDADWEKAAADIAAIRKEIADGLDFAEAAKKYSEDPSRDTGGDLGEVVKGEMVEEFDDVAFNLEPGVVSEPVRTQFGYHLIKVQYKGASEVAPLEKVRGEVENRMYAELVQTAREDWIRRVRKDALINIKLQGN